NLPSISAALFKQLEFSFPPQRVVAAPAVVGQPLRLPNFTKASDALALQFHARELLRSIGADELARKIRVEWNPRLKTVAGRADFREKLISLNPLLRDVRSGPPAHGPETAHATDPPGPDNPP